MSASENKKKSTIPRQASYNSLYLNPLTDSSRHNRSSSEGIPTTTLGFQLSQQNAALISINDKENAPPPKQNVPPAAAGAKDEEKIRKLIDFKCSTTTADRISNNNNALKPTSLQFCMQSNENVFKFGSKMRDPIDDSEHSNSVNIWDYSDSEAAPASSWSTLPNRTLLYRPLPLDIGRCSCVIVREKLQGLDGGLIYSLYTNEGQGRQNRKLAVAHYRRRNGRSQFIVAQNIKGLLCPADDSYLGSVTANLMGSRYCIWDQQGKRLNSSANKSKLLQAVVKFMPTIATWTGSYRCMRAWVPKHQSMQLKGLNQAQHMTGLPEDWESQMGKVQQLFSRAPQYNKMSKQYELDFRDRARGGLRIQSSVKNFQLTMEKNGRQTIVQLGRVGKSKYVMDYRYPLTGYQAFCICLASIDSKLCCTV